MEKRYFGILRKLYQINSLKDVKPSFDLVKKVSEVHN